MQIFTELLWKGWYLMSDSNKKFGKILLISGIALCLIIWIIAFNLSTQRTSEDDDLLSNMTYFKNFELAKYPSGTFTQDDVKGYDIVVYNGWGPWCSACVAEMPDLNRLSQEYADKGILVVGIVADYTQQITNNPKYDQQIADVVESYGITYPIVMCDDEFIDEVQPTMKGCFPATWVVDKDGNLIEYFIGSKSAEDWDACFEKWYQMAQEEKE